MCSLIGEGMSLGVRFQEPCRSQIASQRSLSLYFFLSLSLSLSPLLPASFYWIWIWAPASCLSAWCHAHSNKGNRFTLRICKPQIISFLYTLPWLWHLLTVIEKPLCWCVKLTRSKAEEAWFHFEVLSCLGYFSQCCDKYLLKASYRERAWGSWLADTVYSSREVAASGARGSWSHCASVRKQMEMNACAQLAFSFDSVGDPGQCVRATHTWIGLPTSVNKA